MSEERRPPRNMQGLLHFCTELTAKEDAPNTSNVAPMDPERRDFLANVMSNMTLNMAKQMATDLQTLSTSEHIYEPMEDTESEEYALTDLVEIVHDVDNATDLMKMGGFPVLLSCLKSPHSSVLELACEVIGVACQNNPKCQEEMLKHEHALITLLKMMDNDASVGVRAKALYAVSCLVRSHTPALEAFEEMDGFSFLMRAMQSGSEKLFVKAVFLISHLIENYEPSVAQLLSMGYTDLLVEYLCSGDISSRAQQDPLSAKGSEEEESASRVAAITSNLCREHCTSALLKLCSVSSEAKGVCSRNGPLLEFLALRLEEIKTNDEHQEEIDYITALLKMLKESSSLSTVEDSEACR